MRDNPKLIKKPKTIEDKIAALEFEVVELKAAAASLLKRVHDLEWKARGHVD